MESEKKFGNEGDGLRKRVKKNRTERRSAERKEERRGRKYFLLNGKAGKDKESVGSIRSRKSEENEKK